MLDKEPHSSPCDVLSLEHFCLWGRFVSGTFCSLGLWDFLSIGTFCLGTFWMCIVMPGRRTGSAVGKYMHTVKCREPKTGHQKVQLYYEDDPLCPSRYVYYLSICRISTLTNKQIIYLFWWGGGVWIFLNMS